MDLELAPQHAAFRAGVRELVALDVGERSSAHPAMNGEQQFGRSAVGAMDRECPAEMFSLGAQRGTVIGDQRLIVGAPKLGPPGGDGAEPFGLHEFDTSGIGEAFLRRVHDLHDMTARSVSRFG